jgi:hypothetical protein
VNPGGATDAVANHNRGRGGRSRKRRPSAAKAGGQGAAGATEVATQPGSTVESAGGGGGNGSKASSKTGRGAGKRNAADRGAGEAKRARQRNAAGRERGAGAWRDPLSVGERPRAPWHPLPLSELLILVGGIGTVVGLARLGHGGIAHGGPALFAGIAAVLIGTVEVTLREHLSGYRSHTLILTLLPLIVFHSAVILIAASLTTVPKLLNVVLLLIDVAIGTVLFKLLRLRYIDARRERTFAGRR